MEKHELNDFSRKMEEPSLEEKEFFSLRKALGWGLGLDEEAKLVKQKGPAFIDFEASSLSAVSWPIEVGVSWLEGDEVIVESKLINPRPEWPEEDWNLESAEIHNIPRSDLDTAGMADDVATWLMKTIEGRVLISDAPEFDQRWLNRLLDRSGPEIRDFDQLVWFAFSDSGMVNAGRVNDVYMVLTERKTLHRAGEDAENLCYAWRAGLDT